METNLFWFNDEQWAKIVPHLPTNQPGPERKDDRRVLSGVTPNLYSEGGWEEEANLDSRSGR